MRVLYSVVCLVLLTALVGCSTPPSEPPPAPTLRLETGMHPAGIRHIGVNAAQLYLVTGAYDKTVRLWELASGHLLHTLRSPIGADRQDLHCGPIARRQYRRCGGVDRQGLGWVLLNLPLRPGQRPTAPAPHRPAASDR